MDKKVLVIEDDKTTLKLIKSALSETYKIYAAKNSEEGIDLALAKKPDIILLDLLLPQTSGFELISEFKSTAITQNIPIVVISSKQGSQSRTTAYNLGAINYIEKPFSVKELQSIVSSTIKQLKSDPKELVFGNTRLDLLKHELFIKNELCSLTNSQFKLLVVLCKNLDIVFSRDRLLEIVSSENLETTPRSIDNHVSALRKFLSGSDLEITTIYGKGYKISRK